MPPTPNHVPFLHLHQVTHLVRNSALVRISGIQEDNEFCQLIPKGWWGSTHTFSYKILTSAGLWPCPDLTPQLLVAYAVGAS